VALDLKVGANRHSRRALASIRSPSAGAVPDGARWLWLPASLHRSCKQLLNPRPHRAGGALCLALCRPADKVRQVANDSEKGCSGDWQRGNDRCRASELTVRYPSGEAGGFDGLASEPTAGRACDNLVLPTPARSQEPGQRIPRRGDPPAHPALRGCCSAIWCSTRITAWQSSWWCWWA